MDKEELREQIVNLIYSDAWYHSRTIKVADFEPVTDRILSLFQPLIDDAYQKGKDEMAGSGFNKGYKLGKSGASISNT